MDKRRIQIAMKVLDEIKIEFPETADLIDDRLEQECSKNMAVEEVIFLFTYLEAKSYRRETFFILWCYVLKQGGFY